MRQCALFSVLFFSSVVWSQTCDRPLEQSAPDARFEVDATDSGVVTDLRTGLSWQRCAVGREINDANTDLLSDDSCNLIDQNPQDGIADNADNDLSNDVDLIYSWHGALEYAELVGNGWRIPNLKELSSLVEYACGLPAMNTNVFPNTASANHWSSTTDAVEDSSAWLINFTYGTDESLTKNTDAYLLLVRD